MSDDSEGLRRRKGGSEVRIEAPAGAGAAAAAQAAQATAVAAAAVADYMAKAAAEAARAAAHAARAARGRPTHYPHTPRARQDMLDAALNQADMPEISLDGGGAGSNGSSANGGNGSGGGGSSSGIDSALLLLKMEKFAGFYNLAMLMLLFSLVQACVRNVLRQGSRLDLLGDLGCAPLRRAVCAASLIAAAAVAVAFLTVPLARWFAERAAASAAAQQQAPPVPKKQKGGRKPQQQQQQQLRLLGLLAGGALLCLHLLIAGLGSLAVWRYVGSPAVALPTELFLVALSLKAHSFLATNFALAVQQQQQQQQRRRSSGGRPSLVLAPAAVAAAGPGATGSTQGRRFPANIATDNFLYFLACPSLVYETSFPRAEGGVRWPIVRRKLGWCAACALGLYALLTQFTLPVLRDTAKLGLEPGGGGGVSWAVPVMRLAVPSMLIWLLGFVAVFHCGLGASAEMLRFADREFYGEWWNATTLEDFWREWNRPVHEWCLRHVYIEGRLYGGLGKSGAISAVFLASAVLHELVFSVAFKYASPWFFGGMLVQLPLIQAEKLLRLRHTRRGNLLVWLSLFFGQPMLQMLYVVRYFRQNDRFFCVDAS